MKIRFLLLLLLACGLFGSQTFAQSRITPNQLPGSGVTTDSVTASSYTVACGNITSNSDNSHFKLFSNATSTAVTLFKAGSCGWAPSFVISFGGATGAGTITVTPTTSTIGKVGGTQGATLTINAGEAYFIYTDVSTSTCVTNGCYDALLLNGTGSGSGGPLSTTVKVESSNYNVLATDGTIICKSGATITLETSPSPNYVQHIIKNVDAGNGCPVTTSATGGIDGNTTVTLAPLNSGGINSITVQFDSTDSEWVIQ